MHNELGDEVQVGTRVELVRDAGGNDGEDGSGAFAAAVEPGEEPIFATEDQSTQLTLSAVVGQLDVAVLEEKREPRPLTMEIAERAAERGLGRDEAALLVEPVSKLLDDGDALALAAREALFRGVTGPRRSALDGEERGDQAQAFERDGVSFAHCLDDTPPRMCHSARALAASPLNAVGDRRPVTLHVARQILAEEIADALRVAVRGVEETHPARVGPAPHRAGADALGDSGVQDRDAGRVGAQIARGARARGNQLSNRHEQVDVRGDAARERLRRDVDPGAREAQALSLDGLMLDELIAGGLGDQRIAELAALNDGGGRGGRR